MRCAFALAAASILVHSPLMAETPAALAGFYDGGQTEMATALELGSDGRFRYALSYGALDEAAEGQWSVEGSTLYLTTLPVVVPPRFILEKDTPAPPGTLTVRMTDPDALGGFLLTVIVTYAGDPKPHYIEADEDGRVPIAQGQVVTSAVPAFPVYDIPVAPHAISPGTGHDLLFRFEPNDIGKADFRREPLRIEQGGFVLERHGRTITFRRTDRQEN